MLYNQISIHVKVKGMKYTKQIYKANIQSKYTKQIYKTNIQNKGNSTEI